jgi:hypothetical protein
MGVRGGQGGRAHAGNECYTVEGSRWDNGLAGAEKIVVAAIWEYSRRDHYTSETEDARG